MTTKATLGVVDPAVLARPNHTGEQPIAATTGLQAALDAAGAPTLQKFEADGTWTKPAGCRFVIVEVQAGGGGGRGPSGTSGSAGVAAGGGGAGGYAMALVDVSAIDQETVTIGNGGVAGSAGGDNGSTGGTSSFGTHAIAIGGAGGANNGGAGGTATAGDLQTQGEPGQHRMIAEASTSYSGSGGSSRFAGGGRGAFVAGVGGDGQYGSGGGGGHTNSDGGTGGAGLVLVWEFY